nr:hypothetical protein [Enterococcus gallinarum]
MLPVASLATLEAIRLAKILVTTAITEHSSITPPHKNMAETFFVGMIVSMI